MSILILVAVASMAATVALTVYAAVQQSDAPGQSFRGSIMEAWTNVAIGFGINYAANLLVLPMAGISVTLGDAFWIGCVFTGISVVRSFVIRRFYNSR